MAFYISQPLLLLPLPLRWLLQLLLMLNPFIRLGSTSRRHWSLHAFFARPTAIAILSHWKVAISSNFLSSTIAWNRLRRSDSCQRGFVVAFHGFARCTSQLVDFLRVSLLGFCLAVGSNGIMSVNDGSLSSGGVETDESVEDIEAVDGFPRRSSASAACCSVNGCGISNGCSVEWANPWWSLLYRSPTGVVVVVFLSVFSWNEISMRKTKKIYKCLLLSLNLYLYTTAMSKEKKS